MCVGSIGSTMSSIISVITSVLFLTLNVNAARIFAIFPWPAHSHQVVNHLLSMGLAKRGHELTVFTANPMNIQMPNYTEHSLSHIYPIVHSNFNYVDNGKKGLLQYFKSFVELTEMMADAIYTTTDLKYYLSPNSTKKFDLVIITSVYIDSLYYIAHLFNAPLIITVTSPGFAFNYFETGNPTIPARFPDVYLGYSDSMNFRQRLHNFWHIVHQWYGYHYIAGPAHRGLLKKHFGDNAPSIEDVRRRISMMFLNTHPHLHYPRPLSPNILQIGGFRMGMMNKTLPHEIKTILDEARQGFIYFSLGTNVKSSDLKPEILERIIGAFSELPYLIVWKFDTDFPLTKPSNVLIKKWFPQHGVLAHPNIKLFIYQGGLQSTEEAIECGVPVLGIPILLDQKYNVEALKQKGIAESMDLYTMTKDEFKDNIQKLILNPKYKENVEKLWTVFRDRPQHPLDEAIWWSEFVIRHKGAPYFQSPRLPWYQYHMIDIYAFFIAVFLVLFYFLQKLIKFINVAILTHICSVHKKDVINYSKHEKMK